MGFLDTQEVEITCPNCRRKIKKPLRWFKQDGHTCPGCGALFKTDQFRRAIEQVERQLADLQRSIGKIKL